MNNAPDITLERTHLCFQAPPSGLEKRKYQRYAKSHSTYLGLIACVIQKSPNRRLTFCQIMDSLEPFVSGNKRGLTNNIRVCLSSNDCFVKVPVHPEYPYSNKNFWKVDETRITPKMLRRHFKGMLSIFPDLASRLKGDPDITEEMYTTQNLQKTSGPSIQSCSVVKFSGPFSIESILKKDTRSLPCPKSSALYLLPGSLEGRDQDLKRTGTALGMKRKSGFCGPGESRSEFRGHAKGNANVAFSTNRYTMGHSTMEICRIPECHQTFRPMKRMCISPDFPVTMLQRQFAVTQFHCAQNVTFPNQLHYPLNVFHFGQ